MKNTFTFLLIISLWTSTIFQTNAQSWEVLSSGAFPTVERPYSMKMVDEDVVWMASDLYDAGNSSIKVQRSLDGGLTWNVSMITAPVNSFGWDIAPINDLHAFVANSGYLYDQDGNMANYGGRLLETQDGGASWSVVESYEDTPLLVHFFDDQQGIVIGQDSITSFSIAITEDGGTTWKYAAGEEWNTPDGMSIPAQEINEFPSIGYSMMNGSYDVKGDMIALLMNNGSFWLSLDKGYHWDRIETPMSSMNVNRVGTTISIKDENTFLIAGDLDKNQNVVPLPYTYFTDDRGANWTANSINVNAASSTYIENSDSIYIVAGQHPRPGTVISYDNGSTWTKVDNTRVLLMDFAPSGKGIAAFGNLSIFDNFAENNKMYEWNFDLTSSTEKIDYRPTILTMPNPFTHHLTIDTKHLFGTEEIFIELIGLNGQVFMAKRYKNQSKIELSTKNLPSGIYTLKITGKHKMIVKKVVKI